MNIEIEENNLIKKLESANILSQFPVVSREPQAAGWHINKCLCHKRKGRLLNSLASAIRGSSRNSIVIID